MSWANELYRVYESQCGREFEDGIMLMPVSHSTANAQIQVTLNKDGAFIDARQLEKEEGKNTIIPVTEDSANRTSSPSPMPFADKLIYIAGDYFQFADSKVKEADRDKYFPAYIKNLGEWAESECGHPSVKALYEYLSKGTLIKDLIDCGVLTADEQTGKLSVGVKIAGIEQSDAFVRFRISGVEEPQTWKDKSLYDSFTEWFDRTLGNEQLCYATGEVLPAAEKHPSKIRNSGDKAKLISANDNAGFTYRGRFANSNEAVSISYDFSQKMHNALKWLIQRQGMFFDSMALIVWASDLQELPDIRCEAFPYDDEEDILGTLMMEFSAPPDTKSAYRDMLQKRIFGYKEKMKADTGVMILGVDAATTGRMSVVLYDELAGSDFLRNIESWHRDTACLRYDGKHKANVYNSFSVYDICNCAFGTEGAKGIECKNEVLKNTVLRLIPCITEGKPLPADIVRALYHKASAPLAYNKEYNHRKVVETACGMIRKYNIDRKDGITAMAYDPNETDRSYLYGCLLAVADAAERSTYENEDGRVTNARRYWSAFSGRPFQTWKIIEERLRPYHDKLGKGSVRYEKMLGEIMSKFTAESFADNSALSPAYLLGYHHYNAEIYTSKNKEEEQKNA